MEQKHFITAYEGMAPWDIPGPQPILAALAEAGSIQGDVLDAGCGTGELALFLAARGHQVWGVDYVPVAIERAKAKAAERGLPAHFQVGDALALSKLGRTFDTVIDCGLFHTFDEEDRCRYVLELAQVVRPGGLLHVLSFSDLEPPGRGPRRVGEQELRDAFRDGWNVLEIRPARFQVNDTADSRTFSEGGPYAWLTTVQRAPE